MRFVERLRFVKFGFKFILYVGLLNRIVMVFIVLMGIRGLERLEMCFG